MAARLRREASGRTLRFLKSSGAGTFGMGGIERVAGANCKLQIVRANVGQASRLPGRAKRGLGGWCLSRCDKPVRVERTEWAARRPLRRSTRRDSSQREEFYRVEVSAPCTLRRHTLELRFSRQPRFSPARCRLRDSCAAVPAVPAAGTAGIPARADPGAGRRYHGLPTTGARGATRPTFTADVVGRVAPPAPRTSLTRTHSWLRCYLLAACSK